jgi:hypothetical protein
MTKLLAPMVTLFALTACSGAESADDRSVDDGSRDSTQKTDATPTSDPAAPCPTDPTKSAPARTPSPVERCSGAYKCIGQHLVRLHSDGKQCFYGSGSIVLHADGRVTDADGRQGFWKGDAVHFSVQFPGLYYGKDSPSPLPCELAEDE